MATQMTRFKNPAFVIFYMVLLGALASVVVRFAYCAYVFLQVGESLTSVSVKLLLIDVMELHRFALYGVGGGVVLGVILVLVDLLRYPGRSEQYTWRATEDLNPYVKDEVKARRMQTGDRFLKEHQGKRQNGDAS